jgi:hypothetical protein
MEKPTAPVMEKPTTPVTEKPTAPVVTRYTISIEALMEFYMYMCI